MWHGLSGDKLREKLVTDWYAEEEYEGFDFESVFIEGGVDAYFSGMNFRRERSVTQETVPNRPAFSPCINSHCF